MISLAIITAAAFSAPEGNPTLIWKREKIGDVIYECASAFDVDKDGDYDIVTGEYWFEGPEFKKQHKICDLSRVDDYYDNFSDFPMDVNGDGYLDTIAGGWWGLKMLWHENPQGGTGPWPVHEVAQVGNVERNEFHDLDGDGRMEIISTTKPVNYFRLKVDADGKGTGEFEHYQITEGGGGHGLGVGDINGDKKQDMVFSGGWLESTGDPFDTKAWVWHPDWNFGAASHPIIVYDVNNDGQNDLIVGQAHDYGLAWYEQGKDADGTRVWTKHDIETDRSQFHEMQLVDIDNDGQPELVTGKRYRAHAFNDPGSLDPLGLYYYEINGGDFQRITLDYGPAGRASGTGIGLWIEDIDGNGWKDILAPGKEGCYLFRNMGDGRKKK